MTIHYGDFKGKTTVSAEAYPISYSGSGIFDLSPLAENMMERIPSYFYLGNNIRKIVESLAVVLSKYDEYTADVTDQLFVNTATWGLKYWEQLVGLPVNDTSTDYDARRASILVKLRDCSSEKCFVEGLEGISGGKAIVVDLDPVLNPYQINIELITNNLMYVGPTSAPQAATSGSGNLNGDYTYRVTYEFSPVTLLKPITLYPYGSYGGVFSSEKPAPQRQFLRVTSGTGQFYINVPGIAYDIGPFTETSTASQVVMGLNEAVLDSLGKDAFSYTNSSEVINTTGILLEVAGEYSLGLSLPKITATVLAPSNVVFSADIVNNAEFSQLPITGETSSGVSPVRVNEKQKISKVNDVTSGTFTIKYNTVLDPTLVPIFEETAPLAHTASANQIRDALLALESIYPNSLSVTGGPLPNSPVVIEFVGSESGYPQNILSIDSSQLVGGYYETSREQSGTITYFNSESNTVSAVNNKVTLTNVPRSPDGARKRNIYRKKAEAYNNEWRYVGSIEDNYSTIFVDNVADTSVSEQQVIKVVGDGTFKLKFDDKITSTTFNKLSTGSVIAAALQALVPTANYPAFTVSGSASEVVGTTGVTLVFNGGVSGEDIPLVEIVDNVGLVGYVVNAETPKVLSEKNTAFTYLFERILNYIYVTKPAHIRVRELRGGGFRASINAAGETV